MRPLLCSTVDNFGQTLIRSAIRYVIQPIDFSADSASRSFGWSFNAVRHSVLRSFGPPFSQSILRFRGSFSSVIHIRSFGRSVIRSVYRSVLSIHSVIQSAAPSFGRLCTRRLRYSIFHRKQTANEKTLPPAVVCVPRGERCRERCRNIFIRRTNRQNKIRRLLLQRRRRTHKYPYDAGNYHELETLVGLKTY